MRVCPKCGYVDPPWWRPSRWQPEHDTARIDDLLLHEPELLKQLEREGVVFKGPFVFWKSSRSRRVRRTWIQEWKRFGKSGEPQEKPKTFDFNRKLDEWIR